MKDKLKDIADLFQQAFRSISVLKDEPTAKAQFNRAQTILDNLQKTPHADLAKLSKWRANVRGMVSSPGIRLYDRMKIYSQFWAEVVSKL